MMMEQIRSVLYVIYHVRHVVVDHCALHAPLHIK